MRANTIATVLAAGAVVAALVYAGFADRAIRERPIPPADAGAAGAASAPVVVAKPDAAVVPADAAAAVVEVIAHPLPVDVLATTAVGDWRAYKMHMVLAGKVIPDLVELETVTAVDAHSVTAQLDAETAVVYPRAPVTLEGLTAWHGKPDVLANIVVTDDVRPIGGKRFACKKVTYDATDPAHVHGAEHAELWLDAEVPVRGIVALHSVMTGPDGTLDRTAELVGYGTAKATTWGTRPAAQPATRP